MFAKSFLDVVVFIIYADFYFNLSQVASLDSVFFVSFM